MLVYLAYLLIFVHIALGTLQYEDHPFYWILLIGGFCCISSLHLYSGWKVGKERKETTITFQEAGYFEVGHLDEIGEGEAKMVLINGENIAVFKYEGKVSAVNNICSHQMGPLGEGKIVDGCITCPWHGYQYLPANGQSPPPFKEKLPTYRVKVWQKKIWIDPKPLAPGTFVAPALINTKRYEEK